MSDRNGTTDDLPFGLGVSLYSYTDDIGVTMTVEDCIADVADLGATGLEILGEGHIEDYPNPSTAWIDAWFARNERLGLTPTLYGSWIDTRRFPGRGMTAAEGARAARARPAAGLAPSASRSCAPRSASSPRTSWSTRSGRRPWSATSSWPPTSAS